MEENCDVKAKGNVGCPVRMKDPRSYGPEFNKAGGGFYAVERASNHIKVWFWSRDSENTPVAVKSGAKTVDPDTWVSRVARAFVRGIVLTQVVGRA